jgi:DUF2975 family protein
MHAYRKSRVVKTLTVLVSINYFGMCAGGAILLIGAPVTRLIAPDRPVRKWGFLTVNFGTASLPVPVTVNDSAAVSTSWGPAQLRLRDARGSITWPTMQLPWSVFALLWAHTAVGIALVFLSLHHLRRIFQRVRDGAPFEAQNALRLRWVGLLLLTRALFNGVVALIAAQEGRRLTNSTIAVRPVLDFDLTLVFISLALIALAEIFRRGTELESEQSLVI